MIRNVITRDHVIQPMLEADPTLRPLWEEFYADWRDDAEPPLFVFIGSVARHIADRFDRQDTDGFDAVFDVVEAWHLHGDDYVRNAATIGFLEGLQHRLLAHDLIDKGTRMADIEPWLRPDSRRWWQKVIHFWENGELIRDD